MNSMQGWHDSKNDKRGKPYLGVVVGMSSRKQQGCVAEFFLFHPICHVDPFSSIIWTHDLAV
jgi:hypothetical protein